MNKETRLNIIKNCFMEFAIYFQWSKEMAEKRGGGIDVPAGLSDQAMDKASFIVGLFEEEQKKDDGVYSNLELKEACNTAYEEGHNHGYKQALQDEGREKEIDGKIVSRYEMAAYVNKEMNKLWDGILRRFDPAISELRKLIEDDGSIDQSARIDKLEQNFKKQLFAMQLKVLGEINNSKQNIAHYERESQQLKEKISGLKNALELSNKVVWENGMKIGDRFDEMENRIDRIEYGGMSDSEIKFRKKVRAERKISKKGKK